MVGMDEFGLIRHLVGRLGPPPHDAAVRVGVGDDAAVLATPDGFDWVVTTDSLVEGVHFLPATMAFVDVGYKSVAASVSDIAAMGGHPKYVLMSLVVSKDVPLAALEAIYDGVRECCEEYGCQVIGGNVASTSGPMVITSTVMGTVTAGGAVLRTGARPGDLVFVTGPVGGSGAGLAYLQHDGLAPADEAQNLRRWHQRPRPQVMAGQVLREAGASSLDDISDGLASELNEIAAASGVRLRIDTERVPIAPEVKNFARARGESPLDYAWYGGEDYQLVGTAPPLAFAYALARLQSVGVPLVQIGRVETGDGVVAQGPSQGLEVISPRGYNHFTLKSRPD